MSEPKTVICCPHCTFPVEYCEFSTMWNKCATNLKANHPALFAAFQATKDAKAAAQKAKLAETDPEAAAKLAEEEAKKAEDAEAKKKKKDAEGDDADEDDSDDEEMTFTETTPAAPSGPAKQIVIQVKERTKRKRVTIVTGVEAFGLNVKDVAKAFSKKFATSCSPSDEGLILNGDLSYDISDYMLGTYPDIPRTAYISVQNGIRRKMF